MQDFLVLNLILIWGIILINFLLTIALVRRINKLSSLTGQPIDMLSVGSHAPDFEIMALDGNIITLTAFKNKRIVVFVKPNCDACREQMPKLNSLYDVAPNSNVDLIVISLSNIEETRSYASENGFDVPIYSPIEIDKLIKAYKVVGTPQYYLIDGLGRIEEANFFGREWDQLLQSFDK